MRIFFGLDLTKIELLFRTKLIIDLWVALLNAFVWDSISKCSNDFVECFATSSSILRITLQVVKILTIPTAIPNRAFYSKGNNVGPERPLRPNNWRLWNGTLKRRSTLTFTRARNWLKSKCLQSVLNYSHMQQCLETKRLRKMHQPGCQCIDIPS